MSFPRNKRGRSGGVLFTAAKGQVGFHEDLSRADTRSTLSDRAFGIGFAIVFSVVGALPLIHGRSPRWWAFGVAAGFLAGAVLWPRVLGPANRFWARVATFIGRVVNALLMGTILYVVITPIGLVRRAVGRDPVNRKPDPTSKTYWIERDPGAVSDMRRQF